RDDRTHRNLDRAGISPRGLGCSPDAWPDDISHVFRRSEHAKRDAVGHRCRDVNHPWEDRREVDRDVFSERAQRLPPAHAVNLPLERNLRPLGRVHYATDDLNELSKPRVHVATADAQGELVQMLVTAAHSENEATARELVQIERS